MGDWNSVVITIQYSVTKALARSLAAQAEDIRKKSTGKLETKKAEIYTIWRGENADRYLRKMDILGRKITNNAGGIEESARVIEQMAYNYYMAELRAIEIAKRRSF